jgi:D-hexose-6-phosphate mutarotase
MHTLQHHAIPGRVEIIHGQGGMPAIQVESDWSLAEIYPHGAHVTGFQKKGEAPLLFMSAASEFHADKPIRGGVPVIFPWFGARDGLAFHGFARLATWNLLAAAVLPEGSVSLHFRLPSDEECEVDYFVTVGNSLTLELAVSNTSNEGFTFENCLHTYCQVGAIDAIAVAGLRETRFRDQLASADATETAAAIRFVGEVDRIYQDTTATVDIHDPALGRTIRVRKSGSNTTVVWNPWIAKSKRMPDFGDNEYRHMVCVESGNIAEHAITLAPGECSRMTVEIDSVPFG